MATENTDEKEATKRETVLLSAEAGEAPLRETLLLPPMVPMPRSFREGLGRGPDAQYLEPGLYDGLGKKLGALGDTAPQAQLVIEFAGVTFVWGVFHHHLEPGQQGWLTFENVPGVMPITPFFNEWDGERCEPKLGDALLPLLSSERGRDVARVAGRNDGDQPLTVAAGFIVAQDLDLPPRRGTES